jgi:hypothetical protein
MTIAPLLDSNSFPDIASNPGSSGSIDLTSSRALGFFILIAKLSLL